MNAIAHVLVLEDGAVLAWDGMGNRLPEFEGQRDRVVDKIRGALAEKHTIEKQRGDDFEKVSRWQL